MGDITEKLDAIRQRAEAGGSRPMRIAGDARVQVWPAETWKICESQNDVAQLLDFAQRMEHLRTSITTTALNHATNRPEFADALASVADDIHTELIKALTGGPHDEPQ